MRYFDFVLTTNSEEIKEGAKINIREYDYQNPLAEMNSCMYQNMKGSISFFVYREEGEVTLAAFSYNEKRRLFRDDYDYTLGILNAVYSIKMPLI